MAELVVYPDVEALAIGVLKPHLGSTKVATSVPNPRPDRLVRVWSAGGSDRTMVTSTRLVVVQCWDKASPSASDLAELCFAAVKSAQHDPSRPEIRRVQTVGAPAFFPDPDTNVPRYQFTVAIDVRGAVR